MRPIDPRLLERASGTRHLLVVTILLGLAAAGLIIAQAFLLARIIVAGFQREMTAADLAGPIGALLAVIAARAAIAWLIELTGHAGAARAKSELRMEVLHHVTRLGPGWLSQRETGELTTLCTRGIDSLDGYFANFLPQLVLAFTVPTLVIVAIFTQDPLSALLVLVTVPLIPVFMGVVGKFTGRSVDRQWDALASLTGYFRDVVAGLPTLKAFGRGKVQSTRLRHVGEQYRKTTLKVLRVSFLSSLVLELVATLSVAVVAVAIGLRLVSGGMSLTAGLTVLILAPEAYFPLRRLAQNYHAAAEGIGGADRMLDLLEVPIPEHGDPRTIPDLRTTAIHLNGVTVRYPGRPAAALRDVSLVIQPGVVTAITGLNGSGKSTVLSVLMGFATPRDGTVELRDAAGSVLPLTGLAPAEWRAALAYLPQAPDLGAGTLADAVRLGAPSLTDTAVTEALAAAGLDLRDPANQSALPAGLDTPVGEGGTGLSAGQARRVALARALRRGAQLVLLDEPTAALDGPTEELVIDTVRSLRRMGRTVVLVAHRPALLREADVVVHLERADQPAVAPPQPDPVDDGQAAWTP